MKLSIGRIASVKFKSIVMYFVTLALVLGGVGYAAPKFFGQVANAADFTVCSSGCTNTTINAAISSAAASGDTIFVSPGTYMENVVINKSVELVSFNKNTTIIDGGGNGVVVTITASNVTLQGFTVRNSGADINQHAGIGLVGVATSVTGVTIEDNLITNNVTGIAVMGANSNTIINNTISNSARYGIVLEVSPYNATLHSTANTISENTITANARDGIYVGEDCNSNIINNNAISGATGTTEGSFEGNGIYLWKSADNTVTNNSIFSNVAFGIEIYGSKNNTITGNEVTGNQDGFHIRNINETTYPGYSIRDNNISNNKIYSNTRVNLYGSPNFDFNIKNNWWGSADQTTIESKLASWDASGDVIPGTIVFLNYKPYFISSAMTTLSDITPPVGGELVMTTMLFPSGITVSPVADVYVVPHPLSIDGADVFTSLNVAVTDGSDNLDTDDVPVYIDGSDAEDVYGMMVYNTASHLWEYDQNGSTPIFGTGDHTMTATFSDLSGNTKSLTIRFTTDNTAPVLVQLDENYVPTWGIPEFTNHNTPEYHLSSTEDVSIVYTGGCGNGITNNIYLGNNMVWFGPLADGTYNCTITGTDAAGNVSNILNVSEFSVDTTGPTIASIQNNNHWFNTNFNFILTGVDWDISGKHSAQYRLDSGDWQDLAEALPVGSWYGAYITSEGTHSLEYNLTDNAGNSTTGTVTVMLDKTAPAGGGLTWATANHPGGTTVLPVDNLYTITQPLKGEDIFTSLSLVANDNNINMAPVPVYIDGIANGNMVFDNDDGLWHYNPGTQLNFTQGTHLLRATFTDLAGNTTTLTARFRTDRTAPSGGDLTWSTDFHDEHTVSPVDDLYVIPQVFSLNDSNPSFSLIVNDNNLILDDVDVYIDEDINGYLYYEDGAWYYDDGDWSSLTDGTYELSATFVDRTGYETTLTVEITIDNTAPVITLNGDDTMQVTVGETFADPGAITDDGSEVKVTGSVNNAVAGVYTLSYNSVDASGNVATTVTRTVTVKAVVVTFTYVAGAGGTIDGAGSSSQSFNSGGNTNAVTAVASEGYHFTGWSDGVTSATRDDKNVTVSRSVTANFAANVVTLATNTTTGGEVLGDTTTDTPEKTKDTGEVKGTEDSTKKDAPWYDAAFMGLAWYWWVVLAIAAGGLGWWAFGAIRNRD